MLLRLVIGTLTALHFGLYGDSVLYGSSRYWIPVSVVLLLICARPLTGCDPSVAPIGSLPVVRALRGFQPPKPVADYLRSLLPGWFLVSAVLGACGLYRLGDRGDWVRFAVVLAPVALALLTVVAGQRSLRDRRWLWCSLPASAYAVGIGVHLLDSSLRLLLPPTMRA